MRENRQWKKRIGGILLGFLLAFLIYPCEAYAASFPSEVEELSLTIEYRHGDAPVPNVKFSIYRVADISDDILFSPVDEFAEYNVSLNRLDAAGWKTAAETLAGYVERDRLTAFDSGNTDAEGILRFPTEEKKLDKGVYLVIGQRHITDGRFYSVEPVLVCIPNRNADWRWEGAVRIFPKYTDEGEVTEIRVVKLWDDAGNEEKRPASIEVELLRDGEVVDTVILNKANNWRYEWKNLEKNHEWRVVEKKVPDGYTVSVIRDGIAFIIKNTIPDEPEPEQPTEPEEPTEPETPAEPEEPEESEPVFQAGISQPEEQRLPQTGMLWWPVPVLVFCGILLFSVGWFKSRKCDEDEAES